jgi:hypothetical protein
MFDGFVKEELHGCDTKCWLLFEMLIRYDLFYTKIRLAQDGAFLLSLMVLLKRDFLDVTPNDVYFLKCQQDIIYSKQTMWAP